MTAWYFLFYALNKRIVQSGATNQAFVVNGSVALLLAINVTTVRNLISIVFEVPLVVDHVSDLEGAKLWVAALGFGVVSHFTFQRFGFLERATSGAMEGRYAQRGYRSWHVYLYMGLSFAVFCVTAYLRGKALGWR